MDRPGNALGGFKANLELSKTSDFRFGIQRHPFLCVGRFIICVFEKNLNGQAHNDIELN